MKKLLAITVLTLGLAAFSSPAFADRYWDGHNWQERHHALVVRDRYHGPYYRPYGYPVYPAYGAYVEPVEPVYAPPPVYVAPPVVSFGVRL